jgi:hypothetical protein
MGNSSTGRHGEGVDFYQRPLERSALRASVDTVVSARPPLAVRSTTVPTAAGLRGTLRDPILALSLERIARRRGLDEGEVALLTAGRAGEDAVAEAERRAQVLDRLLRQTKRSRAAAERLLVRTQLLEYVVRLDEAGLALEEKRGPAAGGKRS